MVKPMSVDPGNGVDVDPKRVVEDCDSLDEPLLIVECAMRDPHMNDRRQVQPAREPAKGEISHADCKTCPGAEMSRREIDASRSIGENTRVPNNVIEFQVTLPLPYSYHKC